MLPHGTTCHSCWRAGRRRRRGIDRAEHDEMLLREKERSARTHARTHGRTHVAARARTHAATHLDGLAALEHGTDRCIGHLRCECRSNGWLGSARPQHELAQARTARAQNWQHGAPRGRARAGTFSSSPRLLKSGTRREARCAVAFVCEPMTTRVCVQRTGYVWRALAAGEV